MKIINALKFFIRSASYGVMFALVLLILVPELREKNILPWQLFTKVEKIQAPLSYAKAVRLAGPAVVNIYSEEIQVNPTYGRQPRKVTRLGSGVIMHSQGYILTNYHVVQSADLTVVVLQRGQELHAELIGYDVLTDLAVLKVQANNLPVIPQMSTLTPQVGDVVLAIGNPLNLGQTVTQGIVSATGQSGLSTSYLQFLQMDAAINEGNSGGALINSNGELVGINSRKFTQANPNLNIQGIFFAVPYQLARTIMLKIIEHGRVVRGWLGVEANDSVTNLKGFIIGVVTPDSPAMKAGLQSGDVVYQIDDIRLQNAKQGLDVVAEAAPGTILSFMISRDNQQLTLPVTIVEVPK
ncbi:MULTISPECIES: trypsin-like peptidase domain-containing protein [unclassified Colwellia]|uniref:trypsin-like peptidase domain-containing protein n=1 Tax=unclassified Colwellia TaxID=196834 RepID=UPI00217558AC|nr:MULTISPECIES: trypsin-like peptidase domain-containing protein [unclassified Colwellia]